MSFKNLSKITQVTLTSSVLAVVATISLTAAHGQMPGTTVPAGLNTPNKVDTAIGTLEYTDGAPSVATVQKVNDNLLYVRGVDAFMNNFSSASAYAIRKGFQSIGAEDNTVVIFSDLMDSNSLFLTANADRDDAEGSAATGQYARFILSAGVTIWRLSPRVDSPHCPARKDRSSRIRERRPPIRQTSRAQRKLMLDVELSGVFELRAAIR